MYKIKARGYFMNRVLYRYFDIGLFTTATAVAAAEHSAAVFAAAANENKRHRQTVATVEESVKASALAKTNDK